MDWAMFGWREGILLLMGLAVLYLAVTLLKLMRVKQPAPAAQKLEAPYLTETAGVPEDVIPVEPLAPTEAAPPRSAGFGEQLAEHLARSEMEIEIRRLRKEMEAMRAEMEELRATRHVSPQYAEAMALSQRGLTAQDVADRLDISLGEAELVHALSRSEKNFEQGENDGAERDARVAGGDRFEPSVGIEHRRNG